MHQIEKRGRTLDAVLHPKHYAPFTGIADRDAFESAWQNRRDLIFAHCAHAAYFDADELEDIFEPFGAKISFYDSGMDASGWKRGSQGFLAHWPDRVVLAFRGTEPDEALMLDLMGIEPHHELLGNLLTKPLKFPFIPTDIVDDLDFLPIIFRQERGESKLHRGFYKAIERIRPQISDDLIQLDLAQSQLFATGHSLGAAMAVIAGLIHDFDRIVTFGEPRVGRNIDATMAETCTHRRYVNGKDPVTRVVPKMLYNHHGTEIQITDIDGPDMRYDHSIINYACILGQQG